MNIPKLIDLLERAKHHHDPQCNAMDNRPCDCGADEINKELDEAIAELKSESIAVPIRNIPFPIIVDPGGWFGEK